jgi:hypothetical protein
MGDAEIVETRRQGIKVGLADALVTRYRLVRT